MPAIIFKPTESCNSSCVYCDVVTRKEPKTMTLDMLELVFIKLNEYLSENSNENITLIWHGGEPLLLGPEYFRKAILFQDKHCKTTKHKIAHAIQSNLTLLTQEYIDIFKQLGIHQIGTSCEPIPEIRGPGLSTRNSYKYNMLFLKGLRLLEKNNIGYGFIYVVTKKAIENPLKVFYYLTNLKLSGGFMLNPVLVYDDNKEIAITPMEYVEFLGKIFPIWWEKRARFPDVDPFKSLIRNIQEPGLSLGCVDSGTCAYSHLYIGPNGETSQCGRSGDWGMISYGNIQDRSLQEIFLDKQRDVLYQRNEVLPQNDCKDCRFWNICHGGCPLDAYSKHKTFLKKTNWCAAKKVFIEKYFEPITGIKFSA